MHKLIDSAQQLLKDENDLLLKYTLFFFELEIKSFMPRGNTFKHSESKYSKKNVTMKDLFTQTHF